MNLGEKAAAYWNKDRVSKLISGKKLLILPQTHGEFLFSIGLMNRDASISADQTKKFLQINHMLHLIWPAVEEIRKQNPKKTIHFVDVGCGNSYLSFALLAYWRSKSYSTEEIQILGLDTNSKVVEQATKRADLLGYSSQMKFLPNTLEEALQNEQIGPKVHAVIALHACDTATDQALAFGVKQKAQLLAVAPCCQAELAQFWSGLSSTTNLAEKKEALKSALSLIINTPQLRRESAATFTDALRLALVRACGYEVTATEFVPSSHTPKNRLLLCRKVGNYHTQSFQEFKLLKAGLLDPSLHLENLLQEYIQQINLI